MTILKLWFSTIATTIANFGALLVFAIIYAALLVASYFFISIREATIWQVLITYALMILIPLGFFTLQASIINRVLDQKFRWRVILIDALKFLAVTILVLLVVWLLYYLLNKISARYPAPVEVAATNPATRQAPPTPTPTPATRQAPPTPTPTPASTPAPTPPLHWPSLIFTTLRFVLLGVAFPLATIHLWIAIAGGGVRTLFRGGAKSFFKRIGSALTRTFSADSVLLYGLGLILFFVLPYVILVPTFTIKGSKTEFVVFGLRLLLSFLFSLVGWVITLTALAKVVPGSPPEVSTPVVEQPTEATA
jgi:hypothetical protein